MFSSFFNAFTAPLQFSHRPPNAPVVITAPLDRSSAHQGAVAPTLGITALEYIYKKA